MKLEKAKEILDLNIKEAGKQMPPDVKKALELGVGSIDFVTAWRTGAYFPPDYKLPGETDDNGAH